MQLSLAGYAVEEMNAHSEDPSGCEIWFLSSVDDTTSLDVRN